MKREIFALLSSKCIAEDVFEIKLEGNCEGIYTGQFVNIELEGLYLRRPISVCDYEDGKLTIIYKVVGKGTEQMAGMKAGEKLDVLTGLGNGYDLTLAGERPLLLGVLESFFQGAWSEAFGNSIPCFGAENARFGIVPRFPSGSG